MGVMGCVSENSVIRHPAHVSRRLLSRLKDIDFDSPRIACHVLASPIHTERRQDLPVPSGPNDAILRC